MKLQTQKYLNKFISRLERGVIKGVFKMKVELEKVLNFIRKKSGEYELEGYKRKEQDLNILSKSYFDQCFALEEIANQLEVTAEILGGTNEA